MNQKFIRVKKISKIQIELFIFFHLFLEPLETLNSYNNISMYKYSESENHILKHTRSIRIYVGVEPLKDDIKCYFDNIIFQIFQSKTK